MAVKKQKEDEKKSNGPVLQSKILPGLSLRPWRVPRRASAAKSGKGG